MIDIVSRKPFSSLGNDLYFNLQCTCPHPLFIGSEVEDIMKHKIRFTGYDDDNFFDRVNAAPRTGTCKCGRTYQVQWFRDGVEARFIDKEAT